MRKKVEGTVPKVKLPKKCPFCGAELKPVRITDYINGKETVIGYLHPTEDCILSCFRIYQREVEKWNRREK